MTLTEAAPRLVAPFGRYSRYILLTHLRHLLIISAALLSLALTIDLVPQVGKVLARAGPGHGIRAILLLVIVRAADLFPRFLPLAAYFSVCWTEIFLTNSRERVLLWNSGRTPLRCLVPTLALGLLLAPFQFLFDGFVRPEAVGLQI
ncbi:MAG: LptF/LptG family permease, partial [Alphaproteobacteria bacterium]|nr:LptF/LptG family permease [Alphaproteobacteria bacterium]